MKPVVRECDLCTSVDDEAKHIPLYVLGSEGIWACLSCRLVLTRVAEGIMQASGRRSLADRKRQLRIANARNHGLPAGSPVD
jgi:hypothetical protein